MDGSNTRQGLLRSSCVKAQMFLIQQFTTRFRGFFFFFFWLAVLFTIHNNLQIHDHKSVVSQAVLHNLSAWLSGLDYKTTFCRDLWCEDWHRKWCTTSHKTSFNIKSLNLKYRRGIGAPAKVLINFHWDTDMLSVIFFIPWSELSWGFSSLSLDFGSLAAAHRPLAEIFSILDIWSDPATIQQACSITSL